MSVDSSILILIKVKESHCSKCTSVLGRSYSIYSPQQGDRWPTDHSLIHHENILIHTGISVYFECNDAFLKSIKTDFFIIINNKTRPKCPQILETLLHTANVKRLKTGNSFIIYYCLSFCKRGPRTVEQNGLNGLIFFGVCPLIISNCHAITSQATITIFVLLSHYTSAKPLMN